MAVEVDLRIFGARAYQLRLQALAHRANNMSPVLHHIGEAWLRWNEEQFGTEGRRYLGRKWTKLNFDYLKRRGPGTILFRFGGLFDAVTSEENLRVTDSSVSFDLDGDMNRLGDWHQRGTSKMPARPVVSFTAADRKWMNEAAETYLVDGTLI